MHLRFKRHRWYPKLLKNRDPLVLSAGWRRFQTLPVFSQEDNNQRQRMLKYTPEHMHCRATVYGPLSPPQTGIIAVQNLSASLATWRISATATVLEVDAKFDVVKKLKLVGSPYKIERHTAFVKGMFTSQVRTPFYSQLLCAAVWIWRLHGNAWLQRVAQRVALNASEVVRHAETEHTRCACRWRLQSSSAPPCARSPASAAPSKRRSARARLPAAPPRPAARSAPPSKTSPS